MSLVKGSKFRPLKVVEYNPVIYFLRRFSIVLIVLGAIAGSGFYGYTKGLSGQKQVLFDVEKLSGELSEAKEGKAALEQEIANLKMGSIVDQQASEDVRQQVIDLKEQLAGLKEENSFYRNLMAPTGNKRGLNFGR